MKKDRIMIVEDEAITALDIKQMLEKVGYDVTGIISSGREAVKRAKEIKPDLILMDIMLNDIDGIEANEQIKRHVNIPVIYITANTDSNTIKRAETTKHYGYLIKPVNKNDLTSIISTAIQRHRIETMSDT